MKQYSAGYKSKETVNFLQF